MRTLALMLTAVALAASGCTRVGLADSVDLDFDWHILPGPSDELHTPYVAGADFRLYTIGVDRDATEGWRIASSDPSVLRVDSTLDGSAEVTATGPGTSMLTLVDADGRTVHETPIEVRQPDAAELFAHGALMIDRPELQEDWDEIRVLTGGSATFEVRWMQGSQRLFGHGALSASTEREGEIIVEPRRTFLFEDREWVTFTPLVPGTFDVELRANGAPVRTVRIVAVTEDAVDTLLLHGMDECSARSGDLLTVLAQAYDAEGRPIFGIDYRWDLDGAVQDGYGDLFRYALAPGRTRMLGARSIDVGAAVMIQANDGFVDSTSRLYCAAGAIGLGTRASLPPLAIALVTIVLARRRSRLRRVTTSASCRRL